MTTITEYVLLEKPRSVTSRFLPYQNLKTGDLLRITAEDARSGKGQFVLRVLAGEMKTRIKSTPIFLFHRTDFAVFKSDKGTPFLLDGTFIANAGLSAGHFPRFVLMNKLADGIFCSRDLSFDNFDGKPGRVYVSYVSLVEVFDAHPSDDLLEMERMAAEFSEKIERRESKEKILITKL